ncbi:metal-dependent hydrolase [candidate division TA06 bacterium B3_TA06]|uniref:Metal-dependent hydrolase n=1 Tax=candidate division TA06 bacterium B3_TA06 TaxID=2012487 RepID=A0A532V180_UNCT6|nr:MAG: metal-dependent hydrolase [candidate division TA06 bacterium B3_TA06]
MRDYIYTRRIVNLNVDSPQDSFRILLMQSPKGPSFQFRLKESKRARHVRLKMSVQEGLIVVVPPDFNQERIPDILERNRLWIEKAQRKVEEQRRLFGRKSLESLPEIIQLRAIDEEWLVEYHFTASSRVTAIEKRENTLVISGAIEDPEPCRMALRRWIKRKALEHLVPWFYAVSKEKKIRVSKVLVKNQRSRWGSCTDQKTISLNQKVLFLPVHLMRYVFIHELCHIVHSNHSKRYWDLVKRHELRYKEFDRELRSAWEYIPAWM